MIMLGVALCLLLLRARHMSLVSCWRNLKCFEGLNIYINNIKVSFYKDKFPSSNFSPSLYYDNCLIEIMCILLRSPSWVLLLFHNNKTEEKNLNYADL